jgi:hypothetical protein
LAFEVASVKPSSASTAGPVRVSIQTRCISLLGVAGIEIQFSAWLGKPSLKPRVRELSRPMSCVPSKDPIQRFEDIL